jgi:hypothetical protein
MTRIGLELMKLAVTAAFVLGGVALLYMAAPERMP